MSVCHTGGYDVKNIDNMMENIILLYTFSLSSSVKIAAFGTTVKLLEIQADLNE